MGRLVVEGQHATTRPCQACCAALARYGLVVCFTVDGMPSSERADLIRGAQLKGADKVRYRAGEG